MPAEEASQEVKHAKLNATTNAGGVMKRLDCDSLKKRSPHAEQGLRIPRRYLHMQSWVSAR